MMGFLRFQKINGVRQIGALLISVIFISSCVPSSSGGRKVSSSKSKALASATSTSSGSKATGNTSTRDETTGVDGTVTLSQTTELRHVVDPLDGTFRTKVTIPKNFSGLLYLSGINITALADKRVKVRFKFGRDLFPIDVDATVTRAQNGGITPQTDIQLLVLDMSSKPFSNLRLLYDLYDYNIYQTTDDPIQDNRDNQLYCRGLLLEDDPTFETSTTTGSCSDSGSQCLYAYASVLDKGLTYVSGSTIATIPTSHEINLDGNLTGSTSTYDGDTAANKLKKCLPDDFDSTVLYQDATSNFNYMMAGISALVWGDNALTVGSTEYFYNGPYRAMNTTSWEISANAVVVDAGIGTGTQPTGIFRKSKVAGDFDSGYLSYKFPLAGKLTMKTGDDYVGGTTWYSGKSLQTMLTNGDSNWMDGCNIRVKTTNPVNSEHIGSCNVTGTIEIYYDDENGDEITVDSSIDVKIQIVKESTENSEGKDVLYSNYQTCQGSLGCGSDECCFNSRCWGKDVVFQCLPDSTGGSLGVGVSCTSDYECSSLCCNRSTGKCAVHDTSDADNPVYCSKPSGDTCVAKEWCAIQNVTTCYIVKSGYDAQGNLTCASRCYNVPTHGDCKNGSCVAPAIPTQPPFDPSNPDCSTAIDPPVEFN